MNTPKVSPPTQLVGWQKSHPWASRSGYSGPSLSPTRGWLGRRFGFADQFLSAAWVSRRVALLLCQIDKLVLVRCVSAFPILFAIRMATVSEVRHAGKMSFRIAIAVFLLIASGCVPGGSGDQPDLVWGRQGYSDGRFQKPRAMTADTEGRIYVVDLTARIQVFDGEGRFQRSWQTPSSEFGRPTGLSIDRAGRLMVADTHYYRILFYTPEGELLPDMTIGGTYGGGPGEFGFVTDVVQDEDGCYFVSEYGEFDRIQKFSPERKFICQWGRHGNAPGEFLRPQSMAIDEQRQLWVADACNHRIQIFDLKSEPPAFVRAMGGSDAAAGGWNYPYGLLLGVDDSFYVTEYGGHRVRKFRRDGTPLASWGVPGRLPGQLLQPWSLARDSAGHLHVLDSFNHRVQRIRF